MIQFSVPGIPVGKGRPRFARMKKGVRTYTPAKTAAYEEEVALRARGAMDGKPPMAGPVTADVTLYVVPPASWSKRRRAAALDRQIYPTSKPDIDNCIKGLFDAMNGIVFEDDAQVIGLVVHKFYSETARALIAVTPITAGADA